MAQDIANGQINVSMNATGVDTEIQRLQNNLEKFSKRVSDSGKRAGDGVDQVGRSTKNAAGQVDAASTRMAQSILRQTVALEAGGRQAAEYYRQMAQLNGLNADFLEPYIQKLDQAQNKQKSFISSIGGIKTAIVGAAAVIASSGVIQLATYTDTYTRLSARILNASESQQAYTANLASTIQIAQLAQAPLEAVSTLSSSLTRSLREQGVEQSKINSITTNVALSLKVMGAEAAQTGSIITQLSQAFASGVLRGDEFNSMAENAPPLMQALAKSLGVTIGQLREMAKDGELTTEVLVKAFADGRLTEAMKVQADNMNTFSGAFTNLSNAVVKKIGEIDQAYAASNFFKDAIGGLTGFIDSDFAPEGSYLQRLTKAQKARQASDASRNAKAAENLANYFGYQTDAQLQAARKAAASSMFGGMNPATAGGNTYAPNFTTTIAVENVDEIHKRQEEAAKKQADLDKKAADNKKKLDEAEFKRRKGAAEVYWAAESRRWTQQADAIAERFKQEDKLAKEDYERKQKYLEWLGKQAEENFKAAQDAAKEQDEAMQRQYDRNQDILSREILNSLNRGFGDKGLSIIQNFWDTAKNMAQSVVLEPVIRLGLNASGITGLATSISSMLSGIETGTGVGGAAGAAGTASEASFMDRSLSIVKAITGGFDTLNAGLTGNIEKLGAWIANGNGGLADTIGGFMGQYSTQISQALGIAGTAISAFNYLKDGNYAGAALTAGGYAIGGPVGGAIGAAIGSLFGGKVKTKKYNSSVSGTYSDGNFTSRDTSQFRPLGATGALSGVLESYSKVVSSLLEPFGLDGPVNTGASIFQRSGKKTRAWDYFNASAGGGSYRYSSPQAFPSAQAAMDDLVNTIFTRGITGLVATSKLPEGVRSLFSGLGDKTSIQAMVTAAINLGNAQDALSDRYNLNADLAGKVAKASGYAGEQLATFVNTLAQTALATQKSSVTILKERDKLTEMLDGNLPSTIKAFDEILKGIDTKTLAGQEQFADMFGLRDRFSAFSNAWDTVVGNVDSAIYGLLSPSEQLAKNNENLVKMFSELNLTVPDSLDELLNLGKSIDYTTESGLDLALVFPTLVEAFQTTTGKVNDFVGSMKAMSQYTSLAEYRFAKGISNNYGNQVAEDYTRVGSKLSSNAQGDTTIDGKVVINLLKEIHAMRKSSDDMASAFNRMRLGVTNG